MSRKLKNKPLIEAIFEVRWALKGEESGAATGTDPHFRILLGRLYDKVISEYTEVEQLPAASIPDEIFGRGVQHRFRVKKDGWPLIQVGPGILTVNSTDDYTYDDDFRPRVLLAVEKLFEAHPKPSELAVTNLALRYIDAVEFDYSDNDAFKYIADNLKLQFQMPQNLFETGIEEKPSNFSWQTSHRCTKPQGMITIRFGSGKKNNAPAIVWETIVESAKSGLPKMPDEFDGWIDAAHRVTGDWFFKLIDGQLQRRFAGE